MLKRALWPLALVAFIVSGTGAGASASSQSVTEIGGSFQVPQVSAIQGNVNARLGKYLYYVGSDGEHGTELWRTDGTKNGTKMVADVSAGPASTYIQAIVAAGGKIYFSDGESRTWVTGGTEASTRLLIRAGTWDGADSPTDENRALLRIFTEEYGSELWSTDGTPQGTELMADIWSGSESSQPTDFVQIGDYQYFNAETGTCYCIYRTNGVSVDLIAPAEEQPGTSWGNPLLNVGGQLVFIGGDYVSGFHLTRWDGATFNDVARLYVPSDPVLADGVVYFHANAPGAVPHLFRYDVADDSVTDLNAESGSTYMQGAVAVGKKFIFGQSDGDTRTIWEVSGHEASPRQIATLPPSEVFGAWLDGAVIANKKLFVTVRGEENRQVSYMLPRTGEPVLIPKGMWNPASYYDGLPATVLGGKVVVAGHDHRALTFPVAVTPNGQLSNVVLTQTTGPRLNSFDEAPAAEGVTVNGTFYFVATDDDHGVELWAVPRGANRAKLVKDIYVGEASSNPAQLVGVGRKLMFVATSRGGGTEVWITDGSRQGTKQLVDGIPGSGGSTPYGLVAVGNEGYFTLGETGELWRTNGSVASTERVVVDGSSSDYYMGKIVGVETGAALFTGETEDGYSLYKVGPSMDEAEEVFELSTGYIAIEQLYRLGSRYVYSSYGAGRPGLYALDADFQADPVSLDTFDEDVWFPEIIGVSGDRLIYTHFGVNRGVQIWGTDGTPGGTQKVKDINPKGKNELVVSGSAQIGNVLYLIASKRDQAWQLWRTDGTAGGTHEVKEIANRGQGALSPEDKLHVADGRLFFAAMDNKGRSQLWQSDGTSGGTTIVDQSAVRVGVAGVAGQRVMFFGSRGSENLSLLSVNAS